MSNKQTESIKTDENNENDFCLAQADIEARKELLNTLQTERVQNTPDNNAAAWRMRVKHQMNIHNELQKLGTLAVLACGTLLSSFTEIIHLPVRHSRWKTTLHESPLLGYFNNVQRGWITGAKHQNWCRIEESIKNLGNCLVLAAPNLEDKVLLRGFWHLKLHVLQNCFRTDADTDKYVTYLKWLGKSCQYVFLNEPVEIPNNVIRNAEGKILPFVGEFSYISDNITKFKRRNEPLNYVKANQLTQLAQIPRGHCYPSKMQQITSVRETVEVITSTYRPSGPAIDRHREGLKRAIKRCPRRPPTAHVSLNTSGRLEASRSKGGGGPALIKSARLFTDQDLNFEVLEPLIGRYDQFGEVILSPESVFIAKGLLKRVPYSRSPTVGDILYVRGHEIENLWLSILSKEARRVPPKLGKILNLTASMAIREVGEYNHTPLMTHNIMSFSERNVRFKMGQDFLPVRAGLSIEKGLKTRLTTSGMVAFAHLSQLPANYMREVLSQDPFLRTGLDEPDKLFQVLKAYKFSKSRSS